MEEKQISTSVRRPFPTVGDLFALLGIVLGLQVVVGLLLSVVAGFGGFDAATAAPETLGRYMSLVYLATMSLGLIGAILYRRKRGGAGKIVSFSVARLNPILLLWACVFLVAVSVVIEPLLALLPNLQPDFGRGVWTFVMLVVFAPLFEEFICRGVVLGSLRAKYGVMTAWLGSSLFFGVLHISPMLVVNAFVIGLILGYICLVTDSIWSSVILHAFNNAIAYTMLSIGDGELLLIDWIGNRNSYLAIYCAALVVAFVSAYKMWRTLRHMKETEKNPIGAEE
ncbi:MAG: CPBP family intramembrane metalloprotease [Alistipes sp.]|nr:CPBP family intramembrane metalloprotease [Alistipes sp.]